MPTTRNFKLRLVTGLFCALAAVWSGCSTQQQSHTSNDLKEGVNMHGQGRTDQDRVAAPQPKAPEPAAPAPAPAPAPVVASSNEGTIKTDLVTLQKVAPASVTLGETFEYDLRYTAHENLGSLVITDQPGEGVTYVKSEPAATAADGVLVWALKDIDKGATGTIKLWVKATREGNVANCATVAAIPKVCVGTFVGKAAISIEKTGPAQAVIGSDVAYNIVVKNSGSLAAKDVVVTDTVPDGMTHESGKKTLQFNVGELKPNESKQIPVTLKAAAKGKHCNVAQVTTSNAGKASSEACTTVLVPGLSIVKTGDKMQFLTRTAKYHIVVSNSGETTLTGVVVTDTAPQPTSIATAPGAAINGNTATWNLASLAPGEEKSFDVTLTSKAAGNYCNSATVASAQGLRESSEACTEWRGVSALLLEKADNPDPIQVGETTTYTVRVTNQGTADDTNVKVVVLFPAEVDPVSASNGGVVDGKTVTFPAFPRLTPKQAFEYSIVAKGAKPGDARVKFIRTSDEIPAPTTAEESTRVY